MTKFKVAPAAGGYLRRYGLLPSQITATGPRGHILKSDVLKYAEDNKIKAIDLRTTTSVKVEQQ